jgi:hypothetical protein
MTLTPAGSVDAVNAPCRARRVTAVPAQTGSNPTSHRES